MVTSQNEWKTLEWDLKPQTKLQTYCEGLAPQRSSCEGTPYQATTRMNEQHPKGLPRDAEDDKHSEQDIVITTPIVQRTLSGTTAKTKCHFGKFCKNLQGLYIHQAKTRCWSGKRQKERTDITNKTEENQSRDEHHSFDDLFPSEATQINTQEEQIYPNQRRTQLEPSSDSMKQRIQWPLSDDKRWESFDLDLNKTLGSTLMGSIHNCQLWYTR